MATAAEKPGAVIDATTASQQEDTSRAGGGDGGNKRRRDDDIAAEGCPQEDKALVTQGRDQVCDGCTALAFVFVLVQCL